MRRFDLYAEQIPADQLARAILQDNKHIHILPAYPAENFHPLGNGSWQLGNETYSSYDRALTALLKTAPFQPGEILYLAEGYRGEIGESVCKITYQLGGSQYLNGPVCQSPSRHFQYPCEMPAEAARVFLRAKSIQIKPLHNVSAKDFQDHFGGAEGTPADLWDEARKLHGSWERWESCPWVWVVYWTRVPRTETPCSLKIVGKEDPITKSQPFVCQGPIGPMST